MNAAVHRITSRTLGWTALRFRLGHDILSRFDFQTYLPLLR